jgi:predicted transcriptional regulator of viral defense system
LAIARLAERQHGVVSLGQLQLVGLSKAAVSKRTQNGRLTRIHRGVYAVGHARLTSHGRWMAAVLAHGPSAVLSHRSAAALHGIRQTNRSNVEVTVPGSSARSRPGIDVHRSTTLKPADMTKVDAIPCTSVARTLLDLADIVDLRGVEKAVDRAEVLGVFDLRKVEEVLSRSVGRRGAGVLRRVLAEYERPMLTDRELEERLLALARKAGVRRPEVNAWIVLEDGTAYKVDFLWREERLIVETDGWGSHRTRRAFENDRRRDRRLRLAGWDVVRFTWRDVEREPEEVIATLAALCRARGESRPARAA